MTIYELEKQAKPGLHDRGSGFAEATLTRHCRNNFMRALEALKNQVRMCDECGKSPATRWYLDTNPEQELYFCDNCKHYPTDGIAEENIALVKLIAELEEVK